MTMVLEEKISTLEGAESTLIMVSGMCASTILVMALVPAGGHLVTTTDCYRKTRIFIETMLPKMGITVLLTPTHLAIVMEYAAGGELYERICNAGRFSEDEVPKFEYVLLQVCDMFSLALNEGGSILGVDNGEAEVLFAIDMKLEF